MTTLDWSLAARRAALFAPAGLTTTRVHMTGLVTSLRGAAREALPMVAEITGLDRAAEHADFSPVYVVDRPGWARANVEVFSTLLEGVFEDESAAAGRIAAEEVGAVLALLSTKVLGQFDPFTPGGRLLLVAPNVLTVERELDFDVIDFRLWIALHEQTHSVQFSAAPWLAAHMRTLISRLSAGVTDNGSARLLDALGAVVDLVRGRPSTDLISSVLSPDELQIFDEVTAVMSLLEGHADVVMDAVGPARIPSVRRIRASFERRRDGAGPFDLVVRRLLGLDTKMAQYRNGAAFVRGVVDSVGHSGLNAVWSSPENLPRPAEIADPRLWIARVHG